MFLANRSDTVGRSNSSTVLLEFVARNHALNKTGSLDYNRLGVKDDVGLISVSPKFVDNFLVQV